MDNRSPEEHDILNRIDELERRLAQIEAELIRISQGGDAQPVATNGSAHSHPEGNGAAPSERASEAAGADPVVPTGPGEDADPEREGVRLVVIEMLTAGYAPGQITAYLRQTFGVEDPDALIEAAGPVAG